MSPRENLAYKIAHIVSELKLAQIWGGSVTKHHWMTLPAKNGGPGRDLEYYKVGMSVARWMDGSVRIYKDNALIIDGRGAHAYDVEIRGKKGDVAVRFAAFAWAAWREYSQDLVDRVLDAKDVAELEGFVPADILALAN